MPESYFIKNFDTRISQNVIKLYAKTFLSFSSLYTLLHISPGLGHHTLETILGCSYLLRPAKQVFVFCVPAYFSLLLMCLSGRDRILYVAINVHSSTERKHSLRFKIISPICHRYVFFSHHKWKLKCGSVACI